MDGDEGIAFCTGVGFQRVRADQWAVFEIEPLLAPRLEYLDDFSFALCTDMFVCELQRQILAYLLKELPVLVAETGAEDRIAAQRMFARSPKQVCIDPR